MPFLGNTPANTFVSIAKQTITGNGGTSYALSYPVTNGNEIDVFVNNVRQEPTAAYTASGSTITFTEAITVSDSVYVIFNGQAVGTIDAPAGAYLPTTGGTVNGQLSVNNKIQIQQDAGSNNRLILRGTSGSSYRWNVDNFGSTNRFRIFRENDSDATLGMVAAEFDSLGRLTLPQQPAFTAIKADDGGQIASGAYIFNQVTLNIGNHYNSTNGRFTAPITGTYYFITRLQLYGSISGAAAIYFTVNGSNTGSGDYQTYDQVPNATTHSAPHHAALLYLTAGDYVQVQRSQPTRGMQSNFCGYLVG